MTPNGKPINCKENVSIEPFNDRANLNATIKGPDTISIEILKEIDWGDVDNRYTAAQSLATLESLADANANKPIQFSVQGATCTATSAELKALALTIMENAPLPALPVPVYLKPKEGGKNEDLYAVPPSQKGYASSEQEMARITQALNLNPTPDNNSGNGAPGQYLPRAGMKNENPVYGLQTNKNEGTTQQNSEPQNCPSVMLGKAMNAVAR